VLRIEDTDRARSTAENVEQILEALAHAVKDGQSSTSPV